MYQWLQYYHIPTLVVATKIDKVKGNTWNRQESLIKKTLGLAAGDQLVLFSAVNKTGKDAVWQWIDERTGMK